MPTLETETDYYVLLGVDPGANAVTIRKAVVAAQRRWGARQNAPDLATRQDAERHTQLLANVRDVLLDPSLKALYDVQRVEALPDWLDPSPRHLSGRGTWSGRVAGALVAATLLLFLTTRASTGTIPTSVVARPATPSVLAATHPEIPAAPAQHPTPAQAPTRATIVSRVVPDEVPETLSGPPLPASGVPLQTPPFSLAGGRYIVGWAVAGHQPCDFVISIADSVTPGLIRTTLSNHVMNRSDGQPALGQTSVTLNGGNYRLEAYSDSCTWSIELRAG